MAYCAEPEPGPRYCASFHKLNFSNGHRARHLRQYPAKSDGGRGDGLPATRITIRNVLVALPGKICACLATGMTYLDARNSTFSLNRGGDFRQPFCLGVMSRRPFRRDRGARVAASEGPILILQDTTKFIYGPAQPGKIGFTKTINPGRYKPGQPNVLTLCGVLMHSSLAVTLTGTPSV